MFVMLGSVLTACGDGTSDNRTEIRSVTVFGDSLSDVGTYHAATGDPANPGKFTVNPGNVWVENVAAFYGLTVTPNRSLTMDKDASGGATTQVGTATVIGGNGYAEGGARVSQLPSESGVGNNQLVSPVTQQVARYLAAHGSFSPNALVIVDGGANDTYAQFSAMCWGTDDNGIGAGNTTLDVATAAIAKAANDEVALVRQIVNNGARAVLVASAGDWSVNPFGRQYLSSAYQSTGCYTPVPASQISAWTTQFDQILSAGVANLPGVIYLDTSAVFGDVIANPANYGFVNVTDPACNNTTPTNSAVFCTDATLVSPNATQTYFWSDAFHPTPHGHAILSDRALALLMQYTRQPD
ncbi:SGNH/GDSL hydrolase family protein [Burkholderia guangdongensis]|uniref:SGNH/GDSL hydrolase family protein n=1 Tax=Burkholderia guangdongensis TaxID=1792500 RepID=UPI0015C89C7B|nr:SGNH/GDSL hydrolase family protein [Burkholderia guangdongensis]